MGLIMIPYIRRSERDKLATKFLFSLENFTMKKSDVVIPRIKLIRRYLDNRGRVLAERVNVYHSLDDAIMAYDRAVLFILDGLEYAEVILYNGADKITSCATWERGFCGRKYCGNGYCSMCKYRGVV